jgi:FkbM family methyltransferase
MHILPFKILHKLGLTAHGNFLVPCHQGNKKIRIPIQGNLGYNNTWGHEPWMNLVFTKLIPFFKGNFFDIGVNTGQTLITAKTVFDNFSYYGFEPNSICVSYVGKLVKANNWKDVTIFPVGISEKAEIKKLDFFYEDEIDPSASMVENFRPQQSIHHSTFVPCFAFDEISKFTDIKQNSIIKIDVEGAELEVMKGLKQVLLENKPIVVIEILPVYSSENVFRLNRQDELESILQEAGYSILLIDTAQAELKYLDTIGVNDNTDNVDYLLVPNEKKELLLKAFNK